MDNYSCNQIPVTCEVCATVTTEVCFGTYVLQTGNTPPSPNTIYLWVRNRFQNVFGYQTEYKSMDGAVWIQSDALPDGLFSLPGTFDVWLSTDGDGLDEIPLENFGASCVILNVVEASPPQQSDFNADFNDDF